MTQADLDAVSNEFKMRHPFQDRKHVLSDDKVQTIREHHDTYMKTALIEYTRAIVGAKQDLPADQEQHDAVRRAAGQYIQGHYYLTYYEEQARVMSSAADITVDLPMGTLERVSKLMEEARAGVMASENGEKLLHSLNNAAGRAYRSAGPSRQPGF